MYRCTRLLPKCRQISAVSAVPNRTIFARRSLTPWNMMEDVDRHLARMERDMNAAFRDWGFPNPRIWSYLEPSRDNASLNSKIFPVIETTPAAEAGKPGKYAIKLDLGEDFAPENIQISLKDHTLTIHAKLERNSEDGSSRFYQEISKSFKLPESIKVEEVKSLLTPDGVLTIEAPLPEVEAPKPKEIPISINSKE